MQSSTIPQSFWQITNYLGQYFTDIYALKQIKNSDYNITRKDITEYKCFANNVFIVTKLLIDSVIHSHQADHSVEINKLSHIFFEIMNKNFSTKTINQIKNQINKETLVEFESKVKTGLQVLLTKKSSSEIKCRGC